MLKPKGRAMPTVRCPNCSAKLDAPAEDKGRAVKCKHCGHSFLLRFIGRSRTAIAGKLSDQARPSGESTVSFRLADSAEGAPSGPPERPNKKKPGRQPTLPAENTGEPVSIAAEPWRAAIYQRVTTERFNGNFSAFVRTALDALAEQLGYSVKPPR
jgi:DNA-directed RNA polymerase subunit RPC12/RpoP